MEITRVMDVLVICVPVFAVLGLGKLLGIKGRINEEHCRFINWLVYTFSLPALIINEVSRQRFDSFMDPAVVLMPILGLLIITAVTMLIARINGYKGGFAAAFVFGTFWGNATYVGFPLCQNAFGSEGLAKAAIYNGFVVPFFILTGYALIGFYGAGTGETRFISRVKTAVLNPILLSAVFGIGVALAGEQLRGADGELALPLVAESSLSLISSFMKMIGSMGLPLALLSIGASLKWEQTRAHLGALAWTVGAKLLIFPLIVFTLVRMFCPDSSAEALGVSVILSSVPSAVAMYVISCAVGVERGFVSSMLVISTALSVITIPLWVYAVTGY
ncbi:AEC family transporter [Pontiella sp.]|uniref:AEC family transporter n=1 Tax=Pontiella sp. TaxID=2837462 RepID=UPI00356161CD